MKKTANILCIVATNDMREKFNSHLTHIQKINIVNISAVDMTDSKNIKELKSSKTKSKKINETAGLETLLFIGKESRVMLTRNIDVNIGLTNGSLGFVNNIIFNKDNSTVQCICVKFDNIVEVVKITKITAEFELKKNIFATRRQFPLTLAWAITIHKAQGASLDAIMVDLSAKNIFAKSMGYVALSRCRNLNSVFIIDFCPSVLMCNELAIQEYNRLTKKMPEFPSYNEFNILPEKYADIKKPKKSFNLKGKSLIAESKICSIIVKKKENQVVVKTIDNNNNYLPLNDEMLDDLFNIEDINNPQPKTINNTEWLSTSNLIDYSKLIRNRFPDLVGLCIPHLLRVKRFIETNNNTLNLVFVVPLMMTGEFSFKKISKLFYTIYIYLK
jgi:hypothetical protein